MLSWKCRDIMAQASEVYDGEARWLVRASFKMHLAMCRHCCRYWDQFSAVNRAVGQLQGQAQAAETDLLVSSVLAAMGNNQPR
jgi:predicted anti-sigma-YlaC factor YlaD